MYLLESWVWQEFEEDNFARFKDVQGVYGQIVGLKRILSSSYHISRETRDFGLQRRVLPGSPTGPPGLKTTVGMLPMESLPQFSPPISASEDRGFGFCFISVRLFWGTGPKSLHKSGCSVVFYSCSCRHDL